MARGRDASAAAARLGSGVVMTGGAGSVHREGSWRRGPASPRACSPRDGPHDEWRRPPGKDAAGVAYFVREQARTTHGGMPAPSAQTILPSGVTRTCGGLPLTWTSKEPACGAAVGEPQGGAAGGGAGEALAQRVSPALTGTTDPRERARPGAARSSRAPRCWRRRCRRWRARRRRSTGWAARQGALVEPEPKPSTARAAARAAGRDRRVATLGTARLPVSLR